MEKLYEPILNELRMIFILYSSHAKFVMISDLQVEDQTNLTMKEINEGPH
jgi:hypothetical protein